MVVTPASALLMTVQLVPLAPFEPSFPSLPAAPVSPFVPGATSTDVPSGQVMVATPVVASLATVQFPELPHCAPISDSSGNTTSNLRIGLSGLGRTAGDSRKRADSRLPEALTRRGQSSSTLERGHRETS